MTKKNLCIIASLVIGLSAFLPYLSVSFFGASMSKSLLDGGDGYIVIAIAVIALICCFTEKYIPAVIMGLASLGLFFVENNNITTSLNSSTTDKTSAALVKSMIQNGAGYYCLLIGSVALILFAILAYKEKREALENNAAQEPSEIQETENEQ